MAATSPATIPTPRTARAAATPAWAWPTTGNLRALELDRASLDPETLKRIRNDALCGENEIAGQAWMHTAAANERRTEADMAVKRLRDELADPAGLVTCVVLEDLPAHKRKLRRAETWAAAEAACEGAARAYEAAQDAHTAATREVLTAYETGKFAPHACVLFDYAHTAQIAAAGLHTAAVNAADFAKAAYLDVSEIDRTETSGARRPDVNPVSLRSDAEAYASKTLADWQALRARQDEWLAKHPVCGVSLDE